MVVRSRPILAVACLTVYLLAGTAPAADALTLRDAVSQAIESHPSVASARAALTASEAGVGRARAAYWPTVLAGANVTRYEEPTLVAPLHDFDPMNRPEFDDTVLRTDVSASWTLYDGGARAARVRGARAEANAAAAMNRTSEQSLVARVTVEYLAVLSARDVLEASDRHLEALEAERERVRLLLDEGRAAQLEMMRVDAALADARAGRVGAVARLDLAEGNLARLVDVAPDSVRAERLVGLQLSASMPSRTRDELLRRTAEGSPEFESSREALTAARADHRLAVSSWIPTLDVFGSYLGFGSWDTDLTTEWQVGAAVSFPLFTGGDRLNSQRAAKARVERAREELRLTELEVAGRVDAALNALAMTGARAEAVAEAVRHQEEVVRTELLSLKSGAGTQTDYLRSEADLLRVRSTLVEARNSEIAAAIELARATGELTPAWLHRNLENSR